MAFWPKYNPGDPPPNSARRESAISAMLSPLGVFAGKSPRSGLPDTIRAGVVNLTGSTLPSGPVMAVDLADKEIAPGAAGSIPAQLLDRAIPIRGYDPDRDAGRIWSYLEDPLGNGQYGSAVVAGLIFGVAVSGERKKPYVIPSGGRTFTRANGGTATVVGEYGADSILCLGGGAGGGAYEGCFAVTFTGNKLSVAPGYLTRNGDFVAVPQAAGITPANGVLCLCSSIDEKTNAWSAPEYKITTPSAAAYPIAEISEVRTVGGSTSARIRQFPVTVAVIMLSKPCPLAEY